jgi:hypothetical protein
MDIALGMLGILVWVCVVIALAMAVTWATVKLFPERKSEDALPKSS